MIDSESEFLRAEGSNSVRQGVHWPPVGWRASRAKGADLSAPHNFRPSHNFALFSREWLVTLNCCQLVDWRQTWVSLARLWAKQNCAGAATDAMLFLRPMRTLSIFFEKEPKFMALGIFYWSFNWNMFLQLKTLTQFEIYGNQIYLKQWKNNSCQTKQLLSRHKYK